MADGAVTIKATLDASGVKNGADEAKKSIDEIGEKSAKVGSKSAKDGLDSASEFSTGLAAKAGAISGIVSTLATKAVDAVSNGIKAASEQIGNAVKAYSDWQQNVGGVETLFGDAAGKVEEYASQAYRTAGISANDYMQQASSFAASLVSSLGGNVQQAADMANTAMVDMSDNANIMGTDMGLIQQTYQSLARGNYEMLDNLKLGYGGTKSEMERLISDANEYEKAQGRAGDLTIDSFADQVQAIHDVQEQLGITGDTAREAQGTVQGSFLQMQASWENLVAALGNPDADVGKMAQQFADSAGTFLDNVIPVVEQVFEGVSNALPPLVAELVPTIQGAIDQMEPVLAPVAVDVLESIAQAIADNMPEVLTMIGTVLNAAIDAAIWFPIRDAAVSAFDAVAQDVEGAMDAAAQLVQQAWQAVVDFFAGIPGAIAGFFDGIGAWIGGLFDSAAQWAESAWNGAVAFFAAIPGEIAGFFAGIGDSISQYFWDAVNGAKSAFDNLVSAVRGIPDDIVGFFSGIGERISEAFSGISLSLGSLHVEGSLDPRDWLDGGLPHISWYANGAVFQPGQLTLFGAGDASTTEYMLTQGHLDAIADRMAQRSGGSNVDQTFNIYANDPSLVAAMVASRQRRAYA